MKTVQLLAGAALSGALLLSACSGGSPGSAEGHAPDAIPAAFADPAASGEQLADAWFGLLSLTGREAGQVATSPEEVQRGVDLVRPYLDRAFTLVRASGQRYAVGDYVPLDIDAFEISDVVVTKPRDDIRVLRYVVSQPGATSPDAGVVMSAEKAPRLSVMRWDEERGHWVMVSHANFNTPLAAICSQKPIGISGQPPETSPEDLQLGTTLVEQWRDITTGVSKAKVRHPAAQIQLADGQGWPTADGSAIKWAPAKAYDVQDIGVGRDGDLLVVSYDAVVRDLVVEGDDYRDSVSPRMLTYLRSPEGEWQLIALANFTVPARIPEGVACQKPGP